MIVENILKGIRSSSIRLGYMVSNRELIRYLSKCRSLVETNGFSFEIAKWAFLKKNFKVIQKL